MTEHTYVLVHGAWHGAWAWDEVVAELQKAGKKVATIDSPSSGQNAAALGGLVDDAAAVRGLLDGIDGSKVVVGHSYGGQVISEACAGRSDVAHLVYVCAFMLDQGMSLVDALADGMPDWIEVAEDGASSQARRGEQVFYADVDPEMASRCVARLGHQSVVSFATKLTGAGWRTIDSTYIVCTEDQAIPLPAQEQMSAAAKTVHRMTASHSPFLSQPTALTSLITSVIP